MIVNRRSQVAFGATRYPADLPFPTRPSVTPRRSLAALLALLALPLVLGGCESSLVRSYVPPPIRLEQGERSARVRSWAPSRAAPITTLRPGDRLTMRFRAHPEWDQAMEVQADGTTEVPLVGKVEVAGKTPDQVREEVRPLMENALSDPESLAAFQALRERTVFVGGAVNRPGPVLMSRVRMPLEQALQKAGGLTDAAGIKKTVIIARAGYSGHRVTWKQDVSLLPAMPGLKRPAYLFPGDLVIVPEKPVDRPGPFVESYLRARVSGTGADLLYGLFVTRTPNSPPDAETP